MKNKLILICVSLLAAFSLVGCTGKTAVKVTNNNPKQENQESNSNNNNIIEEKLLSPYTGEDVNKASYDNIAIMAIIENYKDARPQSGLSKADIVYETMAEGGIPRFIALFQKNSAEKVGPIRSARPYFLDIALEYNLPFAHCGGSGEALDRISNENMMSMNEMANGSYFWRDNTRKAPHNLYTSTEKLRALAEAKNFVKPAAVKLKFDDTFWKSSDLADASQVILKLNPSYTTSYVFKNGLYYKSMDGTPTLDKEGNVPIAVKNVVIQATNLTLQADKSHLTIDLVGEGDGYLISNGKYEKIKWYKKDLNSQTILKDESGNDVALSPGKTWWHIIDKSNTVQIK